MSSSSCSRTAKRPSRAPRQLMRSLLPILSSNDGRIGSRLLISCRGALLGLFAVLEQLEELILLDLVGARAGEVVDDLDLAGGLVVGHVLLGPGDEVVLAHALAVVEADDGDGDLALALVGQADHRRFVHGRMLLHGALDLYGED